MGNLSHSPSFSDLSPRSNPYTDYRATGYIRETMFSSRENTETGVTLQTREGDLVTLNSSSFSSQEAFTYDRAGIIETENGQLAFSQQYREITLVSGKSFSFSVEGDLSEQELDDIENLLQGLDGIMASMKQGKMEDALKQSFSLGGYDTVSSFSADLHYTRRVELESSFSAATTQRLSGKELPESEKKSSQMLSPLPGNTAGKKAHPHHLFKLMHDLLHGHTGKTLGKARNPIADLFQHHIKNNDDDDKHREMIDILQSVMKEVDAVIMEMAAELLPQENVVS